MKHGLHALILAAGKGTRFKSRKIKVLHPLLGKSMLQLVVESISRLRPDHIHMVVGYQKEEVKKQNFSRKINFVLQKEQLGTAHAVQAAKNVLRTDPEMDVLIMNGDLPLIRPETLKPILNTHRKTGNSLTFLSADLEDPTGFGRIFYTENSKIKIIEEKDATPAQRKMKEINVGIYVFKIKELLLALPKISNKNKKNEFYLTDIIEIMSNEGQKISPYKTEHNYEVVGVNDRFELARAANVLRERKIKALTEEGVTIRDPLTTWIDQDVKIEKDTNIHPSVVIEGKTWIGEQCEIFPFVHLIDTRVGKRTKILSSTMIENSVIEDDVQIGPYTHLRPDNVIKCGAKVGNFVEMKKTVFGKNSKAGHLSYVGDAEVKEDVNIGAGTITCNYDGKKKHKTFIGEGSFIGSGTQLVAPVKVGKRAYIGAGSTITKDVSPGSLAVSRSPQKEKPRWVKKKEK